MVETKKMLFSSKDIIKIILPVIFQGLLSIAIGMVDSIMVSNKGETAFSGVSLISTLDVLLITMFSSLAVGGEVVLSQAMGRRDQKHACETGKQLIYITSLVAVVITVLSLIFRKDLLFLLYGEVEQAVMDSALSYFLFIAISFPFLAIDCCNASMFRAQGDTITTLKVSIFMNVINVVGNALFIYVCNLDAMGAGIATCLSRIISSVITLVLIHNKNRFIHVEKLLRFKPNAKIIKSILHIGVPNGIESSMFQFGRLMTTSLVSLLGTASIAANAAALTICNIQYTVGNGIQTTMVTVIGRCIGAQEKNQAKFYVKRLLLTSLIIIFVIALLSGIFATPLLKLFSLSSQAENSARQLLLLHMVSSMILWAIAFCLPPAFRAANDVRFSMVTAIISMWLFRVAFAYFFALPSITVFNLTIPALNLGIIGVWTAMIIDWFFRAVLFLIRLISGKWLHAYDKENNSI